MDPETGKATYAIVQAEDELASIGMALGAGWAGARSMTATAGPGISLMSEFVGLGYYAELPAVIFDVERVGPSTGLPDPHPAGRSHHHRAALPRRYASPHVFSVLPRRVLFHDSRGVRPGGALPDPGLRNDRSRSRHEQLDGRSVRVSRKADPARQGAHRRRSRPAGRVRPLQRCRRRRGGLPHAARHQSSGCLLLHARQRPQREGTVHGARRRLHEQHGSSGAQVRIDAPAPARSGGASQRKSEDRIRGGRHFGLRGATKAATS